jgi:hypothetical protein
MANIELMKTNLAKNEEKLAKKVALLAKYESRKAKHSAEWEKLYGESFTDSMKFVYSSEEGNLSVWQKIRNHYGEKAYEIYDKLYPLTREDDYWNPINQTKKGIKELEDRCQKYRDSIAEEEKKNADRIASMNAHTTSINGKDVNVIVEFLNNWEVKVTDHLMKVFDKYVNEADAWWNENVKCLAEYKFENTWGIDRNELEELWAKSEYTKFYPTWVDYNRKGCSRRDPCYNAIKEVIDEAKEMYDMIFSPKTIEKYAKTLHKPSKEVYETNMRKAIANEKNRKYDQLIEDVESIVGKIIDMSHIKVGVKGDLEGYVIGTDGECELWTKGCGGFNENVIVNVKHGQCFHFRFYVRKRA